MSHQFIVSKRGRRLIKAFEGFRPVDRTLVSGQRVVGYGHKVRRPEAMTVTRSEANALLKSDLAPYADMINTEVHAPLNQNQFDALVSLAFSIGPKAFLESPTLHLLNNGRPLDAARSIEIWRKSRIDGKAYVVDALVRRRAQEKALFLRPVTGIVPASRVYLQSVEDSEMSGRIWDEDLPVFEEADAGYVSTAPYDADDYTPAEERFDEGPLDEEPLDDEGLPAVDDYREVEDRPEYEPETFEPETQRATPLTTYTRRREDGPAGVLTLSEVIDDMDDSDAYEEIIDIDDILVEEGLLDDGVLDDERPGLSPIAVAAAEVSDRLDALIGEDAPQEPMVDIAAEWPESLITVDDGSEADEQKWAEPDLDEPDFVEPDLADQAWAEQKWDDEPSEIQDAPETQDKAVYDSKLDEMDADELRKIARNLATEREATLVTFEPSTPDIVPQSEPRGLGPYLVMIVTGLTLMGASLGAMLRGGATQLGESMPFWSAVGLIVGAAILLFALYYILKSILRRV